MTGGIVGEFFALKEETDADLLAMQCGDFYEFFGEDAEFVGDELDLKVSQKSSHGSSYPMAGVPVDDLTPYLKALVERGFRVAVADQYETADGHAREITRVVTPGTLVETGDADARYVASVVDGDPTGVAFVDATTGRFLVTAVDDEPGVFALGSIYVDPARWGEGIGSRLLDRAERDVRERGGDRLRLGVMAANDRAVGFNESRGYERVDAGYDERLDVEQYTYAKEV